MKKYHLRECVSRQEVDKCVQHLAERISSDYRDKRLVMIGVLSGAFIFLADLVRRLDIPVRVDFVRLSSYGSGTETCGAIRITKDVELALKGCHVLIVEDIIDSGITLKWLINHLREMHPESVKVCVFVNKLERREVDLPLDYVGMTVETGFLVGYGMDYAENHRCLPAVHEVVFDASPAETSPGMANRSAEGNN